LPQSGKAGPGAIAWNRPRRFQNGNEKPQNPQTFVKAGEYESVSRAKGCVMQVVRSLVQEDAAQVGWSVRAMLASADGGDPGTARRLAGIGAQVQQAQDIYTAISSVMDDPSAWDMLVVDCDALGGPDEMRRIVKLMGDTMLKVPVILVTAECQTQVFALERHEPTVLRAPLSAVSMRVAFEHVMRDRLVPRFA
jgi:hypothetical protein